MDLISKDPTINAMPFLVVISRVGVRLYGKQRNGRPTASPPITKPSMCSVKS